MVGNIGNQAQCCLLAIKTLRTGIGGVGWETVRRKRSPLPLKSLSTPTPLAVAEMHTTPQARCAHKGPGQEQWAREKGREKGLQAQGGRYLTVDSTVFESTASGCVNQVLKGLL